MEYLFWFSILVLFYTYIGYPLIVFLLSKLSPKRINKDIAYKPFVSVVFSVFNEEKHIEQKLYNLLDSDYPKDKIEILVGSDGSSDNTNSLLLNIHNERVKKFIFGQRRGKVSVLNELVEKAQGEVLVFCDTRQNFAKDAISHLVANFKDTYVGCVSGELIFLNGENSTRISEGIGLYWNYEKFIRKCESMVHSMVGATGAIYAIRKELYVAPPINTILDDVYIPLSIASKKYRCIWEPEARAFDKPAYAPYKEYRR